MIERELTTAQSLTTAGGRLNRDAVGWMGAPLLDTVSECQREERVHSPFGRGNGSATFEPNRTRAS